MMMMLIDVDMPKVRTQFICAGMTRSCRRCGGGVLMGHTGMVRSRGTRCFPPSQSSCSKQG